MKEEIQVFPPEPLGGRFVVSLCFTFRFSVPLCGEGGGIQAQEVQLNNAHKQSHRLWARAHNLRMKLCQGTALLLPQTTLSHGDRLSIVRNLVPLSPAAFSQPVGSTLGSVLRGVWNICFLSRNIS